MQPAPRCRDLCGAAPPPTAWPVLSGCWAVATASLGLSACQRRCRTRSRHLLSVTRNAHGTATEGHFFCSVQRHCRRLSPDEVNKHLSLLKESKLKSAPTPLFFFFFIKNCTCPRLVTVVVALKTQGLLTALLKEPSRSIFGKWKLEKQRRQKTV